METTSRAPTGLARVTRLVGAILIFGLGASLFMQSWRYGLLITVSFGLHELGHILALSHHGIPWKIRLSLLGVAIITPLDARQHLSEFANAQIHLAGPAINLAQALIALAGYAIRGPIDGESWLLMANFAALMVLLNLLPLGRLSDGGKFTRRLFASLSERSEESVIWSLFFWLLSVVWLMAVNWGDPLRTLGTLAVAIWFIAAMLTERQRDEPRSSPAQHRMTRAQGIMLFSAMATALLWATGIMVLTPFWLTVAHAEAMALNVAIVLILMQRTGPVVPAIVLLLAAVLVARALLRRRGSKSRKP